MQAIQFKTIVHDEGTIKIPECYRAILQGEIQLIVLFQDDLKKETALQAASQLATLGGTEMQLDSIPRRRES